MSLEEVLPETFLTTLATNMGAKSAGKAVEKLLPAAPDALTKEVREAASRAESHFYEHFGIQYGSSTTSFLARQENAERIVRSSFHGSDLLSAEDLSGQGFGDADNAPVEVRGFFVDRLHEEMRKSRELAEVLAVQERTIEVEEKWKRVQADLTEIREAVANEKNLRWFGDDISEEAQANYLIYLKRLVDDLSDSARCVPLDVEKVGASTLSTVEASQQQERLPFNESAEKHSDGLIVLGGPGSGKSTSLRQLVYFAALRAASDVSSQFPIPILVECTGESLTEQIVRSLHARGISKKPPSKEWLWEGMSLGAFFLCIDDAHKLFKGKEGSGKQLRGLLSYSKTSQIIIAGRDSEHLRTIKRPMYEMADLTEEQGKALLRKRQADREHARILYWRIRGEKKIEGLTTSPQLLTLVASIYSGGPFEVGSKQEIFQRAFEERNRKAEHTGPLRRIWLKQRLLEMLAYKALCNPDNPYAIEEEKAYASISSTLRSISDEFGIDVGVEEAISTLREQGYLSSQGRSVRFEHDQWQEFFAAGGLIRNRSRLKEIPFTSALQEVAVFAAAKYTVDERFEHQQFWEGFWKDLEAVW